MSIETNGMAEGAVSVSEGESIIGAHPGLGIIAITLGEPRLIELPKIGDPRGNLTFSESHRHMPFEIRRSYWVYDVPGGQMRGGHAYRQLEEFFIALSGSFDVVLDTGRETLRFDLHRSYVGLYVPNMVWRHLERFSTNAVCLILASQPYDEADYIRDYDEFRAAAGTETESR